MKITNHHLESSEVEQIACPKNNKPFAQGQPDSIVMHYTAGSNGLSSAKYLAKNNVKASAHLVIDRTGKIYQLVPFNHEAWHAGASEYAGRSGYNHYSIGIEIDNAGVLEKSGNDYLAWFGKKYPAEEVIQATHRNETSPKYWHIYTQQQIQLCMDICELLIETYPQINSIVGHEEISPGRKSDPGPAFPLDKIRNLLLSADRVEDKLQPGEYSGITTPNALNIRSGPGADYETVTEPLNKGTQLKILNRLGGWYQVKTEIEGWVSADYVSLKKS